MSLVGYTLNNRFSIAAALAQGGFGHTYIAKDLSFNTKPKCILKHLNPIKENLPHLPRIKELFEKEAAILKKLSTYSTQIPTFIDYFEEKGELYLVQEMIEGHTLRQEITPGKKFNQAEVQQLLIDILTPLEFCHAEDLIHRDLKPDNILRRDNGQIVIIDFGMAKDRSKSVEHSLSYGGTPGYAAIEQVHGQPIPASDVYAVGIIAIEALIGIQPHQFERDSKTYEIDWRRFCDVTDRFANIISGMTSSLPVNRQYQNAAEALAALSTLPKPVNNQLPNPTKQPTIINPPDPAPEAKPAIVPPIKTAPVAPPINSPNLFQRIFGGETTQTSSPAPNPPPAPKNNHLTYRFQTITLDERGKVTKQSTGTTTPFNFGETITTDVANFDGNYTYGNALKGKYLKQTTTVGYYGVANDFGLYDMHGNVWEWCLDTLHTNYHQAPVDGSAWIDVKNSTRVLRGGSWVDYPLSRLLRGGSWDFSPHSCRSAGRHGRSPGRGYSAIGFRVVSPQDS